AIVEVMSKSPTGFVGQTAQPVRCKTRADWGSGLLPRRRRRSYRVCQRGRQVPSEQGVEEEPEGAVGLAAVLGTEAEEEDASSEGADVPQRGLPLDLLGAEQPAAL